MCGWPGVDPKTTTIRCVSGVTRARYTSLVGKWIRGRRGQGFYKVFGWVKILSVCDITLNQIRDSDCVAEGLPGYTAAGLLKEFILTARGKKPIKGQRKITMETPAIRIKFKTRQCHKD